MKEKTFICKRCKCRFKKLVYEPGEAKEEGKQGYPITCPQCSYQDIEPC
jgi:hypothetical protein